MRSLPQILAAALLAVASVLLLANLALAALGFSPMKLVPGLTGMITPAPAALGPDALLDGRLQAQFADTLGEKMPFYPAVVRLRNQLYYSLFGQATPPGLMVGRHGTLLETAYAEDYCSRNIAAWRPGALAWARSLRRMQDWYEQRGHLFLYVLTPSKVAQYPDILPRGYHCPAPQADRTGLVPAWLAMLRQAGVRVADAVTPVSRAHAAYPFPLYPPGGTHWNTVGAALGLQTVFAQLDAARPGQGFAPYGITWQMQPHPDGRDRDLARLMNLIWPIDTAPVPQAQLAFPPAPACPARHIVIVGGSFAEFIGDELSVAPCHDPVTEYEYWHTLNLGWPRIGGDLQRRPMLPEQRDAQVRDADILIYEENEQILRDPFAGLALLQFLQTQGLGLDRP